MAPGRSQVKPRNPAFFRGICAIVSRSWPSRLALLFTSLAALAPSSARAFEDKIALAAGGGYAAWPGAPAPHGAALDLQAGLGLSEAWQLRAGAAYALHPSEGPTVHTAGLRAELVYMIDIVDIVPFGGVGVSGIAVFHSQEEMLEPAAHLVAGAAYWLSFDWLIELGVRAHVLPDELEREPLYLVSTLSLVLALDR